MGPGYTRDSFVPLTPVARTSFVLVARRSVGIQTYENFCQYVTNQPSQFTLGFWHDPTSRVIAKWIEIAGLPQPATKSYTGSSTQAQALRSGEIDFAFDTWVAASVNTDVNVIAVLDSDSDLDVTCLSQLYPGIDIDNWYGIVAPANMDPKKAQEIARIIEQGLKQEQYQKRLKDLAFQPWSGTAEDFAEQQTKTIDFYSKL